jgi:hypothetical protein
MSHESDRPKINRREILAAASLPVAAALAPSALLAQERRSQRAAAPKRLRVGINGVDRGHPSQRGDELRGAAAARVSRL